MKVIYHCFGGTHTSVVAAAIHLGWLPRHRPPRPEELLATPLFDRRTSDSWGEVVDVGQDRRGHRVYVLGRGPQGRATIGGLLSGLTLSDDKGLGDEVLLVDTLPAANWLLRLGGYLSRRVGLVSLGRALVIWGTRRAYRQLVALVERVEQGLSGDHGKHGGLPGAPPFPATGRFRRRPG